MRLYTIAVTPASQMLAKEIAQDKDLYLNRLRQMIENPSRDVSEKALEVLLYRKKRSDLIELGDSVLKLQKEGKSFRDSVWLDLWVSRVAGNGVNDWPDLAKWLEEQKQKEGKKLKEGGNGTAPEKSAG